jgi:hypothetical protein
MPDHDINDPDKFEECGVYIVYQKSLARLMIRKPPIPELNTSPSFGGRLRASSERIS